MSADDQAVGSIATSATAVVEADAGEPASELRRASSGRERLLYRLAMVATVVPMFVPAVKRGLDGWEPTWDSATTMVRIRDVFSAHPPLVGMAASLSGGTTGTYSFPGALHLYLLAIPVELFGTTWGGLLGVAVLNSAMCVASIWLIRRMRGERWAMVAAVFLATFLWSVGDATLVFFTPLVMGVVPLFAFFVAAWAVAAGDGPALVVLAFVGNYVFLDQLVFVVVVPLVGATALGLFFVRLRSDRRADAAGSGGARRSKLRWLSAAGVLTVVVWIPPLVDQFVLGGHNLAKIIHSLTTGQAAAHQSAVARPTPAGALGVVASVVAAPRWWLPPSFAHAPFTLNGGGGSPVARAIWLLVLLALLGRVGWRARRRHDFSVVAAVAVVVSGLVAFVVTAWKNPDPYGFRQRYLLGLWPFAAFSWMVVCIGLLSGRRLRERLGPKATAITSIVLLASTVALTTLASIRPVRESDALAPSRQDPLATRIRSEVASQEIGPAPVLVTSTYDMRKFLPSALLGLQDVGTPFRVAGAFDRQQFGAFRAYDRGDDTRTRLVVSSSPPTAADAHLLVALPRTLLLDTDDFVRLDRKMSAWARSPDAFRLAPDLKVDAGTRADLETGLADLLEANNGDHEATLRSEDFLSVVATFGDNHGSPIFTIPGVSGSEFREWAYDQWVRSGFGRTYLYTLPIG